VTTAAFVVDIPATLVLWLWAFGQGGITANTSERQPCLGKRLEISETPCIALTMSQYATGNAPVDLHFTRVRDPRSWSDF
jgi:hypothetical protein